MVLHSLTFSPEYLAGVAAGWKNGSKIGLMPAQQDGSVGVGARAEVPDVSQRRAGFGACPADWPVQPALLGLLGRCRILSKNLAQSVAVS